MIGLQGNFSFGKMEFWFGVALDNEDPLEIGRIRVRIYGVHNEEMKDESLPWVSTLQPITSAALDGIGTSPTGIIKNTLVVGFFVDAAQQVPIILGTLAGIPEENTEFPNESDVNRLARKFKIEETIVQKKKDDIWEGEKAISGSTFKEPKTKYNAKYPHNHVTETENGIITELDDTEDAQRISRWHPTGTFDEIHPDGTNVKKIVTDDYELIAGNKYILVKGDCVVHVMGNAHIKVDGNMYEEVSGDKISDIKGNYKMTIGKNLITDVTQNTTSSTGKNEVRTAEKIFLN